MKTLDEGSVFVKRLSKLFVLDQCAYDRVGVVE